MNEKIDKVKFLKSIITDAPLLHTEWIMKKFMNFSDAEIQENKAILKRENRDKKLRRILGES